MYSTYSKYTYIYDPEKFFESYFTCEIQGGLCNKLFMIFTTMAYTKNMEKHFGLNQKKHM